MQATAQVTQRIEGHAEIGTRHIQSISMAKRSIRDLIDMGLTIPEVVHGLGQDLMMQDIGLWERIDAFAEQDGVLVVYRARAS